MTLQGNNYPPSVLPADHVVQEILWELHQLSFAQEFLSLDCCACSNMNTSNDMQLMQRQAMISECFAINPFLSGSLMDYNFGLAVDTIKECLPFILCLVCIIKSWKGNKHPILNLVAPSYQKITRSQAIGFEEATTKYYSQKFFNYFGLQPWFLIVSLCL